MTGASKRVALEKTLRDGRTAVVTAYLGGTGDRHAVTTVTIDGEEVSSGLTPYAAPREVREAHPELVAAIGPLLLTEAERDQVRAVLRDLAATVPPDLDAEREHLVRMRDGAEQEPAIIAAERMEHGGYPNPFSGEEYEAAQAAALRAQAALEAFDAQHPEVRGRADAQREADAVRRIQNGL